MVARAGAVPRVVPGGDARRNGSGRRGDAAHAAVPAGEGQDHRPGTGQRQQGGGLHPRHRVRGDGHLGRDGAARAYPAGHLHPERGRRRGRAARAAARAIEIARPRDAADPQRAGAHQEPGPARHPEARGRELLADVPRDVDDDRLPETAAHDRTQAARRERGLPAADAHASSGDGARDAERHAPGLFRCRHRRRGHLDQCRHGADPAGVAIPADSAQSLGHFRLGSGRLPDARRRPGFRSHRVPQFPAGRPQSARPKSAPRLPARRHRRPQVPGAVPRLDGSGEKRAAAGEILETPNSQLPTPKEMAKFPGPLVLLFFLGVGGWELGVVVAQDAADPVLEYQRAGAFFGEGRYAEALRAFDAATRSDDAALTDRARKGKVRSALRIAEFTVAREEAEHFAGRADDGEASALLGDALWSMGQFDEADPEYARALAINPDSSRGRFGAARSLAMRSRLDEALALTLTTIESAPRDPDLRALAGSILERLNRFDAAASEYVNYAALLPPGEATAISTARARADFLRSFAGRPPLDIDPRDAKAAHTLPFKLVRNKVVVQGRLNGLGVEWVLDTGAERTGISHELAYRGRIRSVTTTYTAGVGRASLRQIQLGRADTLDVGGLRIRNVPVSIRNPAVDGAPRWQGQTLSPLALGLSVIVDYQRRQVTLARRLSDERRGFTLPLRMHRLPFVRRSEERRVG